MTEQTKQQEKKTDEDIQCAKEIQQDIDAIQILCKAARTAEIINSSKRSFKEFQKEVKKND